MKKNRTKGHHVCQTARIFMTSEVSASWKEIRRRGVLPIIIRSPAPQQHGEDCLGRPYFFIVDL